MAFRFDGGLMVTCVVKFNVDEEHAINFNFLSCQLYGSFDSS